MELKNYEEFKIDDVFSTFTGSVQKVDEENDVFLIGWGLQRENQHALMSEIDFKNNKVLTEAIEADIENDSYRLMKCNHDNLLFVSILLCSTCIAKLKQSCLN